MPIFQVQNCRTCEVLREQLDRVEMEKNRLLEYILAKPVIPLDTPVSSLGTEEPVQPKFIPWNVRRQMLENEDREKFKLMERQKKEQAEAILELEQKLKLDKEVKNGIS